MSYASDRERADRFIPQIKQIAGPHLLIATPDDIDCRQAADLMILKARDMTIGARVRKHEYLDRYRYQITIRAKRDSGAKTELAKIIDGWGDWLFYAFADLFDERIALWRLIDLDVFRADLIRNQELIKRGDGSNGDGTHFKWFDLRSFDPSILIATSEPLPSSAAATATQQPAQPSKQRESEMPPIGTQGILF